MASSNWLNQILGGIAGAGTGLAQQRKTAQDQQDREAQQKLQQLNTLMTASQNGFDIGGSGDDTPSPPTTPALPPTPRPATPGIQPPVGMTPPPAAAPPPSVRSNVLGDVGGRSISVPDGGLIGKAARDAERKAQQGMAQRMQTLQGLGDPDLKPSDMALLAQNESAFNSYVSGHYGPRATPAKQKVVGPDGRVQFVDPDNPPPGLRERVPEGPQDHFTTVQSVDESGKPVWAIVNTRTGQIQQTSTAAKPTGQGGAQGEMNHARIAAAGAQIAHADDDMTAFEDQVMAGKAALSGTTLELARKAMSADFGSAMAYQILVKKNSAVAKYVRSAKEAATAERMITPRGGSNTLMQAEQALMSAGAGGDSTLINQARAYRQTLRHALSNGAEQTPVGGAVSDADLWEQYVNQGFTSAQATAKVQARHRGGQ